MMNILLIRKPFFAAVLFASLAALVILPTAPAADHTPLKPLLAIPNKAVLQEDYSQPKKLAAEIYSIRQGTQWAIEDGVLRGRGGRSSRRSTRKKNRSSRQPRST
jgi:hypothetical protein